MSVLFTNRANTIIASNITNSQTTIPLNAGTGALFPSPTGGDFVMGTLISASNPNTYEIVRVTSRSTDTLTVVRAQEGTTGQAFTASDVFALLPTAGSLNDMRTHESLPTSTGSANAQAVTNTVPILILSKGTKQKMIPGFTNSGAMTLAVDGTAATAVHAFGLPLVGGEVPAGIVSVFEFDGTVWNALNPILGPLGLLSGILEATVFTANGNFTPLATAKYLVIALGGGGGGGGGAGIGAGPTAAGLGGSGGSGGQLGIAIVSLTAGTPYAVVIGAGGGGGNSGGGTITPGSAGGNTTFNAVTVAVGGSGGLSNDFATGSLAGSHSPGGMNGGGNGGGAGGAPVSGAGNGNSGAAASANTGGGGGGGSGGNSSGTAKAGGTGGTGGSGILLVMRA